MPRMKTDGPVLLTHRTLARMLDRHKNLENKAFPVDLCHQNPYNDVNREGCIRPPPGPRHDAPCQEQGTP